MAARALRPQTFGAALALAVLAGAGAAAAGPPASSCGCQGGVKSSGGARTYTYGGASGSTFSATGVSVQISGATSTGVNAQAIVNGATGGYGGGGGYTDLGGVTTSLGSVEVEEAHPICLAWRARLRTVRLEASCIDDKDVPHPASQVFPDRQVPHGYEGEVYRCIAGTRMRYLVGADAQGGESFVCGKGEALVRSAAGGLSCRPQKPARDCNERSLLRRYGAGYKLVEIAGDRECASWSNGGGSTAAAGVEPAAP